MSKCLYCYKELTDGEVDFHKGCAKKFFGMQNITLLHKKRCFYSTIIAYLRIFVFVKLRYFSRLTKDSDKLLFVGSVARNS